MMQLFIERQQADINVGFSTMLSFAVDDIKDFGAKNTTFSKTIILPGTKVNNLLFGSIFEVTNSNDYDPTKPNVGFNFNAAVSASAYIFNDNIQVFKGILRLMEIVIDGDYIEYEVSVYGELGGFVGKLGNNKLDQLDFSAYNHIYSIAAITATWANANVGSGYYYPLIDYGNYSTAKHNWKVKTFRPALFAKEYIDKIFAAAGYTYDCPLFLTTRFKGLIIPHNQKVLQKKSSLQIDIYTTDTSAQSIYADGTNYPLIVAGVILLGSFTSSLGNTRFTYGGASITGSVTIIADIILDASFIDSGSNLALLFYNSSNVIYKTVGIGFAAGGTVQNTNATIIENNITIISGDYIQLVAFGFDSTSPTNQFNVTLKSLEIQFGNTGINYAPVNIGESLLANDILPQNILQKDFISGIIKLFNLYIYEDSQLDKVLKIAPFADDGTSTGFFAAALKEDWSMKLDRSLPIKVKPMSELNARYYEFEFKKDSDYWNDLYEKRYNIGYGNYLYDSAFEFAKETEKVELVFSATPLIGYQGQDKIYSTIFKRTGEGAAVVEENVDSNIRILQAKNVTGVTSWNILADDGTTILGSYTNYPYAGHLNDPDSPSNDLNFGVPKELFFTLLAGALNINQFNVYWGAYMAEITNKDSRLLTATFKLSFKDIYTIDFSKFKWIDGNLYRLNKITDYNATNEDICVVELIKVINTVY